MLRSAFSGQLKGEVFSLNELRHQSNFLSEEWEDKIASTYIKNMYKAHKIAQGYGIPALILFQPLLYYKDEDSVHELEKSIYYGNEEIRQFSKRMRKKIIQEAARHIVRYPDFRFTDFSYFVNHDSRAIFSDYVHTSQGANQFLAKKMRAVIIGIMDEQNN